MISVILGTYNRIEKLKKCIDSIKKSNIKEPAEIIIIDGNSTDGSVEFIKSHPDIIYINEGGLHGVTRAYNRGFRLSSRKYITWGSDDFVFMPDTLQNAVDRLEKEDWKTMISFSSDFMDGRGYISYTDCAPTGACYKDLFKYIDYWSEDFITYASDSDFTVKAYMSGGKAVPEFECKIQHKLDVNDYLHQQNLADIKCIDRYNQLYINDRNYMKYIRKYKNTYIDIWINATSIDELVHKLEKARLNNGWVNFHTDKGFDKINLLNSLNISVGPFKGNNNYCKVL
jgi:glycosyltransferase involved in cell wall biosynthesis